MQLNNIEIFEKYTLHQLINVALTVLTKKQL